jgi:hypothetical protein
MADILHKLYRRGCWGGRYVPMEALRSWVSSGIKRNGKRVAKLIRELQRNRLIYTHKRGGAISLRSDKQVEIKDFMDEHLLE